MLIDDEHPYQDGSPLGRTQALSRNMEFDPSPIGSIRFLFALSQPPGGSSATLKNRYFEATDANEHALLDVTTGLIPSAHPAVLSRHTDRWTV
jgi:hypothetical protein